MNLNRIEGTKLRMLLNKPRVLVPAPPAFQAAGVTHKAIAVFSAEYPSSARMWRGMLMSKYPGAMHPTEN